MSWEEVLITLYLEISKEFKEKISVNCQRFTNGGYKGFSDEEVMTIYLFGVLRKHRELKASHRYAQDHLLSWFPHLPKYAAFVHRVNRLSEAFRSFIALWQEKHIAVDDEGEYLVDSFPIALAQHQHAYRASVAKEVASRSYCATKKLHYYGVRAHVVARKRVGRLPDLEILWLDEAARQDGPMFDQFRPFLHDNLVFGDQAYKRPDAAKIELEQEIKVITPITKARGQTELAPEQKKISKAVSSMRQPIESLFAWINRLTNIENAGLVRSTAGLFVHIFGKIAAAMLVKLIPQFRL